VIRIFESVLYVYKTNTLVCVQKCVSSVTQLGYRKESNTLKSMLGLALAVVVLLAFGVAWIMATRDGASFLDQQWLFFTALPYNILLVTFFGGSDFSADAPGQVAAAASCEAAVAYGLGAGVQAAARALWRWGRRSSAPT
jgi:hypothetical protein